MPTFFFHIQEENSQYKVIEKLRAIGCEFGPCLNAYTGIEETVYEFLVPTDDQEVLPQVLAIVAEFAFKIRSAPIWTTSCTPRSFIPPSKPLEQQTFLYCASCRRGRLSLHTLVLRYISCQPAVHRLDEQTSTDWQASDERSTSLSPQLR